MRMIFERMKQNAESYIKDGGEMIKNWNTLSQRAGFSLFLAIKENLENEFHFFLSFTHNFKWLKITHICLI